MAKKDNKEVEEKKAIKKPKKEKVKKEKVKKVNTKKEKKLDTVVFVDNDEQAEQVLKQVMEAPFESSKEQKKKNFWSEVKALFTIILIIAGVVGGGFLIHKFVKPLESKKTTDEETKVVESSDYKTVVYKASEDRFLRVLENQYLIEYEDNTLYKVLDMDGNLLFEGNEGFSDLLLGVDGELYLAMVGANQEADNTSMSIYRFNDKKLEEVYTAAEEGYYYTLLLYNNNGVDRLLGVVGENDYFVDDDYKTKSVFHTLDNKKYDLADVRITGDVVRLAVDQPIYTYNKDYVIVKDTNDEYQFGIFDINAGEMILKTKYDGLYSTESGNYIAVKGNKVGVVNVKSKILIDFKYDFIYDAGSFYVTGKDKKLGIINNEFKEVIKPTFTFQQVGTAGFRYQPCCGVVNSFSAIKYKDKYVLTVNEWEMDLGLKYKVHETYVIDSSGEYLTIGANDFGIEENFIYSYDKDAKKYIIYDDTFAEKYSIDISKYDFEEPPYISLINENTITVYLDTELYYDYSTGEEIEALKDATFVVDKIEFKYIAQDEEVTLKVNGEVISTYKYEVEESYGKFYNNVNDKLYYYVTDNMYVMVRKSV